MLRCWRDLTTSGRLRQHRARACLVSEPERVIAVEASVAKLSPADRASILNQSLAHFRNPSGPDLLKRTERFNDFIQSRAEFGLWPYSRALEQANGPLTAVSDITAATREGINFASQDYLGLSRHQSVADAGIEAMRRVRPPQRRLRRPARQHAAVAGAGAESGGTPRHGARHALSDRMGGRLRGDRGLRAPARPHRHGLSVPRLPAAGRGVGHAADQALHPQRRRGPQGPAAVDPRQGRPQRHHGDHRGAVRDGVRRARPRGLPGGLQRERRDAARRRGAGPGRPGAGRRRHDRGARVGRARSTW